ncbi:hypothetical protein D3C81_1213930 [compost metagenome]
MRLARAGVRRLVGANGARAFGQVGGVQQRLGRHRAGPAHGVDIAHMGLQVGKGELHRLDLEVHGAGAVEPGLGNIPMFEHAQRHQRANALAVRADFVQFQIAVGHADRLDPVRAVGGEVGFVDAAPGGAGMVGNLSCQFTVIEVLPAGAGDAGQRFRLSGADKALAGQRRPATRGERLGKTGLVAQHRHLGLPLAMDRMRDHVAMGGVLDGRLEQVLERQRAEAFPRGAPARDCAGHRHAVPAGEGHGAVAGERFGRPGTRRAAGGVEAVQRLAVPDQREGVAANAVHARFHYGQRDGGGQRGIHGIAAPREHAQAGGCCQWLRRGDHIVGKHRQAARRVRKIPESGHERLGQIRKMGGASQAGDESGRRPGRVAELR